MESERLNIVLKSSLKQKLEKFCDDRGLSLSEVVRFAITNYLFSVEKHEKNMQNTYLN